MKAKLGEDFTPALIPQSDRMYFMDANRIYFTKASDPDTWEPISMSRQEFGWSWHLCDFSRSNRARLRAQDAWRKKGITPTALRVIRP